MKVEDGFGLLNVDEKYKCEALKNINIWLGKEEYKPQIVDLIVRQKWDMLLDSFYQTIPFGTGGRRGPVGIGTNRINPWTMTTSVQGHVEYMKKSLAKGSVSPLPTPHSPLPTDYMKNNLAKGSVSVGIADDAKRFNDSKCVYKDIPNPVLGITSRDLYYVVIAYDVRVFNDLRGIYNKDIPNPVLGITSRDLAHIAAQVYAANGITVFISDNYLSTPELSFFIRRIGADGGLNISASHNHPDDNGGKFYDNRGGQAIPPEDEVMANLVEKSGEPKMIDYEKAVKDGLIRPIPEELQKEYIALNLSLSLRKKERCARVVFTPLHGTGLATASRVLKEAGFSVVDVEQQSILDGNFPYVKYRIPNPEVPESMELAAKYAKELNADIVISTDPDADRIGVMLPDNKQNWVFLTGNEIAVLITHYILKTKKELGTLPKNPILVKTEVTTELISKIGDSFSAKTIPDLLVGFKYIADIIYQLEIKGDTEDFIIGMEESHGILVTPEIRDKDAAGAALLLAEMASYFKSGGKLLHNYLNDIYKEYGYYKTHLAMTVMEGATGMERMTVIQKELRKNPPKEIAGIEVISVVDHLDEKGVFGPIKSKTDESARNFLIFKLKDGTKLVIRPSGTEPKNKIYIEAKGILADKDEIDRSVLAMSDDFTCKMLNIIGVKLPAYALRISGLVSLDNKIDFVERFLPEFAQQTEMVLSGERSEEEIIGWLDKRLSRYGKDAKGLVANGLRRYIEDEIKGLMESDFKYKILKKEEQLFF
ncbi:MAG: phospho-sugar mutase [bacterium]